MLRALWEWLWKARERRWTPQETQEQVLALRLEWDEVMEKLMAREDRERKRRMKALRDMQEPQQEVGIPDVASTRDELRARLRAIRGGK